MAYNPFLSIGEPDAPVTMESFNPFMMTEMVQTTVSGDNPFAASNPFSDFGGELEPAAGDTVPMDIFGGGQLPEIGAKHFDVFSEENEGIDELIISQHMETDRLTKPSELELFSTSPDCSHLDEEIASAAQSSANLLPRETQNLILSVTGQMEYTSSHLLDRIPPTRTPSPVSIRDIHSPSLTPEPEYLDEHLVSAETPDANRNKPTRPAPARPPPVSRPPPPRPAAPLHVKPFRPHTPPNSSLDDINLFEAPVPVAVKPTKEHILSLYSTPKKEEEKQIDFLSDDILDSLPNTQFKIQPQFSNTVTKTLSLVEPDKNELDDIRKTSQSDTLTLVFDSNSESNVATVTAMDCSEPSGDFEVYSSKTSPFANEGDDYSQMKHVNETDINPFEKVGTEDVNFNNTAVDISGSPLTSSKNDFNTEHKSDNFSIPITEPVEYIQGQTFDNITTDSFNNDQLNAFDNSLQNDFSNTSEAVESCNTVWDKIPELAAQEFSETEDAFDAFTAKFDSTAANHIKTDAWGSEATAEVAPTGFEAEVFDPFLSLAAPPVGAIVRRDSGDSENDTFSVFIKPKEHETNGEDSSVPALAPPPPRGHAATAAFTDGSRVNPFDAGVFQTLPLTLPKTEGDGEHGEHGERGEGAETPPTPLFDEDTSAPLEQFPRTSYAGPGWEMHLRQPNKKKITGQRFWKKVFVVVSCEGSGAAVQLYNAPGDKEPFQELPLQACYSVSEVGAQQFDQFGKIFTVKLQYVFYKERPGVRPGQVTKAERLTNKLSQFAAYAIQGDYQGVKEFGSDLRKLGLPVEHAPQVSQLFKLGSLSYEDVRQFSCCVEEALFRLPAHRDRALAYKMEEVQITCVDELYVEQDAEGSVLKQVARVRLFFLGFLSGMPDVEVGLNDLRRQGREVVGRHDIVPGATEEWIRVEDAQFHACVQPEQFEHDQILKFKPPDACYVEVIRFRVRPPKNRELPLQLRAVWCVTGNKVELRADVLVPGFASRRLGQVPCEDVAIRFPVPECWIYLFRVEKHFRYGSVKSAHRRTGKIKGIERLLGAVDALQESLIEVTSGAAKYEHHHRALVWRMPRLPKEGQGAYTTHNLVCRLALTSYDQVPEELARWAYVEFTMPATTVSRATVRSVALHDHDGEPPEKFVRYLARHDYLVGIERTSGQSTPAYSLATATSPRAPPAEHEAAAPPNPHPPQPPSSDSDSE